MKATIPQVRLANVLCRFVELAEGTPAALPSDAATPERVGDLPVSGSRGRPSVGLLVSVDVFLEVTATLVDGEHWTSRARETLG